MDNIRYVKYRGFYAYHDNLLIALLEHSKNLFYKVFARFIPRYRNYEKKRILLNQICKELASPEFVNRNLDDRE